MLNVRGFKLYHTTEAAAVKGLQENRSLGFTLDKTLYIVKSLYKKTGWLVHCIRHQISGPACYKHCMQKVEQRNNEADSKTDPGTGNYSTICR